MSGTPLGTLLMAALVGLTGVAGAQGTEWPQHSMERPRPPIVRAGRPAPPLAAPSDAVILFDGSLAAWRSTDSAGGPARWKVGGGVFEVVPGAGGIRTVREFGDVQLHLEWQSPSPPAGSGQDRGNSGVFLMGRYEVQILDSFGNDTYPDGQAAAIYGQFPPLVNVSRAPGEWQSYDIVFRRPHFREGQLVVPARMTIFHNGVLVHEDVVLQGTTSHRERPRYEAHPDRLPITLQDHDHRVRFRNVWVRELPPAAP